MEASCLMIGLLVAVGDMRAAEGYLLEVLAWAAFGRVPGIGN